MTRPAPGEMLHFSKDPSIHVFVPRRAPTAQTDRPYVWAVDAELTAGSWSPRRCPRAMAWPVASTARSDVRRLLGPGGCRVHAVEQRWLPRLRDTTLYAYRLPAHSVRPIGSPRQYACVSTEAVRLLAPAEPVRDLPGLRCAAGIELRVLDPCGRSGTRWWAARVRSAECGCATPE